MLWLGETEAGTVSRYAVLVDAGQLPPDLERHVERFGHVPRWVARDRKVYSIGYEQHARDRGVRHVVLPRSGRPGAERMAYQKQRWFTRGRRWRTGIEGRSARSNGGTGSIAAHITVPRGWSGGSAGT